MGTDRSEDGGCLAGKTIVVTRPIEQLESLAAPLRDHGARVVSFPTIAIEPVDAPDRFDALDAYDWLVFASANGVRYFCELLQSRGDRLDQHGIVRIAAVGAATATEIEAAGGRVDLVPHTYTAAGLLDAFDDQLDRFRGQRFLIPRGDLSKDTLTRGLREREADVEEVTVYHTVCPDVAPAEVQALVDAAPDVVVFSSPSTVRNFVTIVGQSTLDRLEARSLFASIGPITSAAMREAGIDVAIEPEESSAAGLVEALILRYKETGAV